MIVDFPKIEGKPRCSKQLPEQVITDAGSDNKATRALPSWMET